jgi:hypothetical protein
LKKKLLIILPIVVVLLLAGYLFGVPAMQTNSYKSTARTSQLALSASVAKAITAANQNAFLDPEITMAEAKNATIISKNAAADLETKIKSNESGLTSFNELALIAAVNPSYKSTIELNKLEKDYVKTSKEYLAEFQAVNKYNEQTLPILEISEQLPDILAKFETAESEQDFYAVIDELVAKLDQATKIGAALTPPESVKEAHEFNLKGLREVTTIFKKMKTAVQAMDVEALMTLQTDADKKMTSMEKDGKKLTLKLIEQSKLTKLGDTLNKINKDIDLKTAKL